MFHYLAQQYIYKLCLCFLTKLFCSGINKDYIYIYVYACVNVKEHERYAD